MDKKPKLKYQKDYSIIINDAEQSVYYYINYDERVRRMNMEFQHEHRFHEIMIPLTPGCTHVIEGIPYALEPGDLVLLKPTLLHRTEYPAGAPSRRIIIDFWYPKDFFGASAYYLPLLEPFCAELPIFRFPETGQEQLFAQLDEIFTFSRPQTYLQRPEERLILHSLFLRFLHTLYRLSPGNIYSTAPTRFAGGQKIYDVVYYIHNHYRDDLSLELLAGEFYLSTSYLSHQFKKVTGFTLTDYIQRTRSAKVKDLLLSTDESISSISQACGFQSFSQFNRIFRKIYGQSPSAMRSCSTAIWQYSGASEDS